ncbi:MAG: EAL domain-containing protein [Rhizobiales bacterium]|nr:EAL domain-containing protein [Hyphomicrobiales bacterium]
MRAGQIFTRVLLGVAALFLAGEAVAIEAVSLPIDARTVDLGGAVELYSNQAERIQVSTAPGADGIVRRIEVRSESPGRSSDWAVFALANPSDEQIDRLLVAPHYRLVGSGLIWPDLGSERIRTVTPSEGFAPERLASSGADIFRITLDPGAVVTFVGELSNPALPEIQLWQPDAYEDMVNSYTLYRGVVLGIAGLLALFLSVLFVVKGTAMFPATAALAWAVLAYISIDFGFWSRVFQSTAGNVETWRAGTEVVLAGALLIFLYTYLHLHRWHVRYSHFAVLWLLGLAVLAGIIAVDPSVAAGAARISLGLTAAVGLGVVLYFSIRGFDRAIMLIPTWLILVFWVAAAGLAVTGRISHPVVHPALAGGLVLVVMLIAFTIMQHAFAGGALAQGLISDAEQKALALVGAGHSIWDWDTARDRIETGREVEQALGFKKGALAGPARNWLGLIHPSERELFRAVLDAVVNQRRGRINMAFRMRAEDGHHLWFALKARPIVGSDGEVMRCSGTIADITDAKLGEERLLHDSIHDNLTGLPNRQIFLDRLETALVRSRAERVTAPTVLVLDLDNFKRVNSDFSYSVGDSVLLALSRRMSRLLRPQDGLARMEGDSFAVLVLSETDQETIAQLADELARSLKAPISVGDTDVFLTASIGIAPPLGDHTAEEHLRHAEAAVYQAKRFGGDYVQFYESTFGMRSRRLDLEAELEKAMEGGSLEIVYQPVIRLADNSVAGFEALTRWEHPLHGRIAPSEFIGAAEESGQIVQLGLYVLERAARELASWQAATTSTSLPFVSINVSSRQLLRHDLINDVKAVLARTGVAPETLKLEITESMVMQNPQYAAKVLGRIRELGAGLALDDFGAGYSALAYLQLFPFDTIKIDKSFVRPNGSPSRSVILRAIVSLAHELGMEVVAEGAETEAEVAELVECGCEYVQGFFYGKPMTAQMVQQMMRRRPAVARAS